MPRRQEGIPALPVLVGTCSAAERLFKVLNGRNLSLERIWLGVSLAALIRVSGKKPLKAHLGFGCCS